MPIIATASIDLGASTFQRLIASKTHQKVYYLYLYTLVSIRQKRLYSSSDIKLD